jgi:hypothetical protein
LFIRDEEKERTYNRTGVILEIDRDDDDIFANLFLVGIGIGIIWTLIGKIF